MKKLIAKVQRGAIERLLNQGLSCQNIADELGLDHSVVSREIKRNRGINENPLSQCTHSKKTGNCCVHYWKRDCTRKELCEKRCVTKPCMNCGAKCNALCSMFKELICPRLSKFPYVCNHCEKIGSCILRKQFYYAEEAQFKADRRRSESRAGVAAPPEELPRIEAILVNGLQKGQSFYHIYQTNRDDFNCSVKTLYRYKNLGCFSFAKKKFRQKQRSKSTEFRVDPLCRINRNHEDYLSFMERTEYPPVVEMDTVVSARGSNRALLTFNFNSCGMMLAFLLERKTSQAVIEVFDYLEQLFGLETFKRLFPVILTDNGSEFSNPERLEQSCTGNAKRTMIFYCDPYRSSQKARVENNHLFLRRVLPKGTVFSHLTQEKINLIISHMGSYTRLQYQNIKAITQFNEFYGETILKKLGIRLIPGNEVNLTPNLIKD